MATTVQPRIIYPEGFDSRWEAEMPLKGYLSDALVQLEDGSRYRVNFIDPVRLQQDLAGESEAGSPYFAEPGLIIVPEVTTESIRCAVEGLWQEGFFDHLKPI